MFNHFINCTCQDEVVYSSYTTVFGSDNSEADMYIEPAANAKKKEYCPFDIIEEIVYDYLYIGYLRSTSQNYRDNVINFVSSYGDLSRGKNKINIADFAEDAELLYLHFTEIMSRPYPKNPEWVLEPSIAPLTPVVSDGKTVLMWHTENLANAIEIGYTMLLASDKNLGLCKHCKRPYIAQNPKREFCSSECRNIYNVRKHRAK